MTHDNDYVLCECDLAPLQELVTRLETQHAITIIKEPAVCLTMIKAEDSLDRQEFYLGEALTTECEVDIDGSTGYGVCLGDEPVRGYCLAVVDALTHSSNGITSEVVAFIDEQRRLIADREIEEFNHILSTHVDFKLMEQE